MANIILPDTSNFPITENVDGKIVLRKEVFNAFRSLDEMEKKIKDAKQTLRNRVQVAMTRNGILKAESIDKKVTVTSIAPTTKEQFDTKRFKDENPQIYDAYTSLSTVKATIRVSVE